MKGELLRERITIGLGRNLTLGNSKDSTRIAPAKAASNSGEQARTGLPL